MNFKFKLFNNHIDDSFHTTNSIEITTQNQIDFSTWRTPGLDPHTLTEDENSTEGWVSAISKMDFEKISTRLDLIDFLDWKISDLDSYTLIKDNNLNEEWFSAISEMDFDKTSTRLDWKDFECNFQDQLSNKCRNSSYKFLLQKIDHALSSYKSYFHEATNEKSSMELPSVWSIVNLLYLVPAFTKHNPQLDIDADTGCFIATFDTRNQGVMSVLITDGNEVHYSLIDEGCKIVKTSGTTKIRDKRDFSKFSNVLLMLYGK